MAIVLGPIPAFAIPYGVVQIVRRMPVLTSVRAVVSVLATIIAIVLTNNHGVEMHVTNPCAWG